MDEENPAPLQHDNKTLLTSNKRRRKSDHLFGMGNPGAGPRWLAEARHGSAF